MNNIEIKVAPKGEGKTKWLIDIASNYAESNRKIFIATKDELEYSKFCEKYFSLFGKVCPVLRLTSSDECADAILLVDDLFNHVYYVDDILSLQKICYKMFITIEGICNI